MAPRPPRSRRKAATPLQSPAKTRATRGSAKKAAAQTTAKDRKQKGKKPVTPADTPVPEDGKRAQAEPTVLPVVRPSREPAPTAATTPGSGARVSKKREENGAQAQTTTTRARQQEESAPSATMSSESRKRKREVNGAARRLTVDGIGFVVKSAKTAETSSATDRRPIPTPRSSSELVNGTRAPLLPKDTRANPSEPSEHSAQAASEQDSLSPRYRAHEIIGSYEVLQTIGHGQFSTAYLVTPKPGSRPGSSRYPFYTLKRMRTQYGEIGELEHQLLTELHTLNPECRTIVKPIEAFYDGESYCIVLENLVSPQRRAIQLPSCTCSESSHHPAACPERLEALAHLLRQLLEGLSTLHKYEICHGDLTGSNILYASAAARIERVKLIDLGNALREPDRVVYMTDWNLQTPLYRAPEILLGAGPISTKIDVFSLGLVALEWLLADFVVGDGVEGAELLRSPVEGHDGLVRRVVELFGSILALEDGDMWDEVYASLSIRWGFKKGTGKVPIGEKTGCLWETMRTWGVDEEFISFMESMLQVDPTRRKSARALLKEPWLVKTLLGEWWEVLREPEVVGEEDTCHYSYPPARPLDTSPMSSPAKSPQPSSSKAPSSSKPPKRQTVEEIPETPADAGSPELGTPAINPPREHSVSPSQASPVKGQEPYASDSPEPVWGVGVQNSGLATPREEDATWGMGWEDEEDADDVSLVEPQGPVEKDVQTSWDGWEEEEALVQMVPLGV